MIVVIAEMSPRPRRDVIGSNDGRRPSQPDEKDEEHSKHYPSIGSCGKSSCGSFGQRMSSPYSKWRKGLLFQGVL
jgi:hypothetical protein